MEGIQQDIMENILEIDNKQMNDMVATIIHDKKKKEVIIEVANKYKEKIPEKVYNALINWIPDYIDYSEYE